MLRLPSMTTMVRPGSGLGTPRGSALAAYLERYQRLSGQHSLDLAVINALRLKRADALITGVFENSFDAIAIIGGDGRIESANNGLARLFGRAPEADGGFSWEKTDLVDALKKAV